MQKKLLTEKFAKRFLDEEEDVEVEGLEGSSLISIWGSCFGKFVDVPACRKSLSIISGTSELLICDCWKKKRYIFIYYS